MHDVKKEYLTWADIHQYCDTIVSHLKSLDQVPDIIVPIIRCGLIPGTIIAHSFGVSDVRPVRIQTRDGHPEPDHSWADICKETGYRVLVVDEILDSGLTFEMLLSAGSPAAVNYAFLIANKDASVYNPTSNACAARVISREIDTDWFVFPWEK